MRRSDRTHHNVCAIIPRSLSWIICLSVSYFTILSQARSRDLMVIDLVRLGHVLLATVTVVSNCYYVAILSGKTHVAL